VGSDGLENLSRGENAIKNVSVLGTGELVPLRTADTETKDSENVIDEVQVALPGGLEVIKGILSSGVASVGLVPVNLTGSDEGQGVLKRHVNKQQHERYSSI
jgi:hypothetical protein